MNTRVKSALSLTCETMDLPLRPGERLYRPPGWRPCMTREVAEWCRDHLGPVTLLGEGNNAVLRMSPRDYNGLHPAVAVMAAKPEGVAPERAIADLDAIADREDAETWNGIDAAILNLPEPRRTLVKLPEA